MTDKHCSYGALRDFKEKDTENEASAQSVSLNLVVMNSYKKDKKTNNNNKSFPVRTVISMHAGTEYLLRCHAVIYNDNAIGTFSNI